MRRPEPVTAVPPRTVSRALLRQSWLDVGFVHWAVDPRRVAPLLPPGTVPDVFDGSAHVGLVPFRMSRTALFGTPPIPYLGDFPETNVRLYSVDSAGRRGVVFRSLDAARLLPAIAGRAGLGLAYAWARMRVSRDGDVVTYRCRRRWPGPRGSGGTVALRVGDPIGDPSDLELFLTARWGLHVHRRGRTRYLPNTHPQWSLRRATLLECDTDLVAAAGIDVTTKPVSVLYSPGVAARFGRPSA